MIKLSMSLENALAKAGRLTKEHRHSEIHEAHLLAALLADRHLIYSQIFTKSNVDPTSLCSNMLSQLDKKLQTSHHNNQPSVSSSLQQIFGNLAQNSSEAYLNTDGFIIQVLHESEFIIKHIKKVKGDINTIVKQIKLQTNHNQDKNISDPGVEPISPYTTDVTKLAQLGKLDPVIGRDLETRHAMRILQRRTKNNPILLGPPGVGKTAIIEGIAQRIATGDVPDMLSQYKILSLDIASLLAGASVRGEFEQRVKDLLSKIIDSEQKYILFIDEIHTIVGAGKAEGALDIANILKPALARGQLHCIGASTIDEYQKYIEKDKALERRFQTVYVNEPNLEDSAAILRGLREKYESHHGVTITDAAIVSAVNLSTRYITSKYLPDKAIDLIDEAAARLRTNAYSKPESIEDLEREKMRLSIEKESLQRDVNLEDQNKIPQIDAKLESLQAKLEIQNVNWQQARTLIKQLSISKNLKDKLRIELEDHSRNGNWAAAAEIQNGQLPKLEQEIAQQESQLEKSNILRAQVQTQDIAAIISTSTGIPVNKMLDSEHADLRLLEHTIARSVIGQTDAIAKVSSAIKRAKLNLNDPNKPLCSFMFLGSTGVGKTYLCKCLAENLFGQQQHIVRLDMSEYMEKHQVARLIGAPPGYIGHEEGGQLTEAIRHTPYNLVLFDEIEKAHPDVTNILLQILEEGVLTDSKGRTINFKNTVIVMTCNYKADLSSIDNEDMINEKLQNILCDHFRPELINRIDEIIQFNDLSTNNFKDIFKRELHTLNLKLTDQAVSLEVSDKSLQRMVSQYVDTGFGARPIKRIVQNKISSQIADFILNNNNAQNLRLSVDFDANNHILIKQHKNH